MHEGSYLYRGRNTPPPVFFKGTFLTGANPAIFGSWHPLLEDGKSTNLGRNPSPPILLLLVSWNYMYICIFFNHITDDKNSFHFCKFICNTNILEIIMKTFPRGLPREARYHSMVLAPYVNNQERRGIWNDEVIMLK